LEAITAEHPNLTIEELLYDWPATKFEAFYTALAKRKIADELSQSRSMERAAVWGNMNYDSEEHPEIRQDLMEHIDSGYSKAIAKLYGEVFPEDEVDEIDPDDPWFQAIERGKERYSLTDE